MDRVHHQMQARIHQPFGFFRVQTLHDVHGAFDVSEQDGDDFAFAFEGGPAREDTVGKVRGSVDDWSGVRSLESRRVERLESRVWGLRRRGRCDKGGATFSTKLLTGQGRLTTPWTREQEASATFLTEFHPAAIGRPTFCALHSHAFSYSWARKVR